MWTCNETQIVPKIVPARSNGDRGEKGNGMDRYTVGPLQAADAEGLFEQEEVSVAIISTDDGTSAHAPSVELSSPDAETLLRFVRESWGDDDALWWETVVLDSLSLWKEDEGRAYRLGTFRLGDGGRVVRGITDGSTWNGARNVWITAETLLALLPDIRADLAHAGRSVRIEGDLATGARSAGLVETNENGEEQRTDLPAVEFMGSVYFGLINGWLWSEVGHRSLRPCPVCEGRGEIAQDYDAPRECRECDGEGAVEA